VKDALLARDKHRPRRTRRNTKVADAKLYAPPFTFIWEYSDASASAEALSEAADIPLQLLARNIPFLMLKTRARRGNCAGVKQSHFRVMGFNRRETSSPDHFSGFNKHACQRYSFSFFGLLLRNQ
jgi:hypothetical protein